MGDADPLQAMDDALRLFGADEIIIATHARGDSNWLARDVVTRAHRRFPVPIQHLPVATVSLYAYINPIIAVVLGTLILDEPLSPRIAVAGAIVLLGTALTRHADR